VFQRFNFLKPHQHTGLLVLAVGSEYRRKNLDFDRVVNSQGTNTTMSLLPFDIVKWGEVRHTVVLSHTRKRVDTCVPSQTSHNETGICYEYPLLCWQLVPVPDIYPCSCYICIHGHRTLNAPHPVRSAQLTRVPPS
jgi:hypothetical protein